MSNTHIVRFIKNGYIYNLDTKQTYPKGTNIIHSPVYWGVSKEWAKKIALEHKLKIVYSN